MKKNRGSVGFLGDGDGQNGWDGRKSLDFCAEQKRLRSLNDNQRQFFEKKVAQLYWDLPAKEKPREDGRKYSLIM